MRAARGGRLDGKVALITGAARGIGRAQAVRFAQEGADIVALDVCGPIDTVLVPHSTPDDLDTTASLVREADGRVHPEIVDVRDLAGMRAATDRGAARFGGLDVVCATAGITSRGMAVELDENAWRTMLDVNLTGVWHTCRAGVPHLIARGAGSVILTSSIAGLRGLVGVAHYTAAKHGVVGLMRSLANELAPHHVRVNCVNPTNVDTPMIQNDVVSSAFRPDLDRPPTRAEFADAARSMNMLAVPWIDPLDVANAALFLASDEARYITAITLPVDAGATQK
ncbi:mycofactocin-coupled SDR family oxidoreductase [Mycobacterium intracellulare]|uniref:mycofactocin-coupled SDR family oxidoreductase n=1 Tax=Mycobacterium intracellulare TaxID=1767 RepID=UPI0001B45B9A|nr:mycofactocin-coupled SDR family oxidoreductase [Mycobacterium intracellulare]ASW95762.1 SDR family mycofactocin-dependent oxidoreductase [Mycobacterium intracellulare]MCA2232392.1 mycofactocin-coupled SDR family oxidoreductase [Mycobacterium intracellulare]PBA22451.1 SDR family mycofactocin-dependent oxidoreductase [Mycobacterium intracellulare]UGU08652.1 mycofactocin-coupled SDR family oxidoreductase [Mycobacterium intracellulare subsp. intracellulare]BCO57753.1 putative short chain dehydr